jgi:predicted dehydrogenase
VDVAEADEVLHAAEASKRLVCVGHDQLFDPAWQECRDLYRRGDLGQVVHVDAILGYDMSGPFGKVTASEPDHWVHRLPGGLFHNTISHALYKILDFLPDEQPRVWATWFGEGKGAGCPTELRVLLQGAQVTGNLVSTSAARPVQRLTRVYGTRRGIEVDLDGRLVRQYRSPGLRGPFIKLEMPWRHLREAARTLRRNLGRFLRSELHYFTGMHGLFTRYYRAILEGGELPIPHAEIRRCTAILDQIFHCCRENEVRPPHAEENHAHAAASRISEPVGNGVRQ